MRRRAALETPGALAAWRARLLEVSLRRTAVTALKPSPAFTRAPYAAALTRFVAFRRGVLAPQRIETAGVAVVCGGFLAFDRHPLHRDRAAPAISSDGAFDARARSLFGALIALLAQRRNMFARSAF